MTAPTKRSNGNGGGGGNGGSTEAQSSNSGKLVVRTTGFVARTDAKSTSTKRYRRGEEFQPVEGLHDVEALIKAKVLGRHTDDKPASAVTALVVSKAAAELNDEDSPVVDLESQPFELREDKGDEPELNEDQRNSDSNPDA